MLRQLRRDPGQTIYRKIFFRLFWGWLGLCLFIGGGVAWLELHRLALAVRELATQEAAHFSPDTAHALQQLDAQSKVKLDQLADKLLSRHFLEIKIYDYNKHVEFEVYRKGILPEELNGERYRRHFPVGDDVSYDTLWINGQMRLLILTPLFTKDTNILVGYFEGIYQLDPQMFHAMQQDLLQTLFLVTVGTSFTTLLMYPLLVGLVRGVVRLSHSLMQGNFELLNVLGCAIAERDAETNSHNYRVTYYALRLGEAMGLNSEALRQLLAGAFLHDVGKIGIRDPILLKPGKLTPAEFEMIKQHVILGVEILKRSSWLSGARQVVEFHHEKFDGSGYPKGLRGEQIPLPARIFAIVDVFDALTSERPYKPAWELSAALDTLRKGAGSHFDPAVLAVFLRMATELHAEVTDLPAAELESLLHPIFARYYLLTHEV